jgi:uncharacterized protein (TIGR02594 family)
VSELKWLAIAKQSIGLAEVQGPKHNSTILKWLAQLKAWWKEDETPWCGTFVAHCLQDAGYAIAKDRFRALGWRDWGKIVSPQLGAIMVFSRQGGGHVAFYIGEDVRRYYVLGGNQGNKVGYTWIAKSRLVACRWPVEVPVPNTGRVMLAANGQATSNNEA